MHVFCQNQGNSVSYKMNGILNQLFSVLQSDDYTTISDCVRKFVIQFSAC